MWELIDGERTLEAIRDALCAEYRAPKETIEKDLLEFIKDMKSIRAIG
jgi:hypothetical protein